ncbi:MAG: class I SAM-dependent methyltransferase [Bosea sp. (in: a-proteobacteria)]
MSFSAEWLALREPVDHRSVNHELAARVADWFGTPDHISVMDIGCGAGSNLRGTYGLFGDSQHWTLVDYDPLLLSAARTRLMDWADEASEAGEEVMLIKDGKRLMVDFRRADLNIDLERVLDWRPDLVTAAALFDLVSPSWIARFVGALKDRRLPLYTVLTYDGREIWQPAHPADADMVAAFHSHQHSDKGFGPAAGPDACAAMAEACRQAGYLAETADSPWVMTSADTTLVAALTSGIAGAVRETGKVPEVEISSWLAAKSAAQQGLVGHLDLFARPV